MLLILLKELLENRTPEGISTKVRELTDLFSTGLIISPSHEAILPHIKPENVEALFGAINN